MAQAAGPVPDLARKETAPNSKTRACGECHKVFYVKSIARHLAVVHGKGRYYPCSRCGKRCGSPSDLRKHQQSKHPPTSGHLCKEPGCRKVFSSPRNLRRHQLRIHIRRSKYGPQCQLQCASVMGTKKHEMADHSKIKPFKCDICWKGFTTSYHVKRHKLTVHDKLSPRKQVTLRCDQCKKTFPSSVELKEHMAIHRVDRLYACSQCGKHFKTLRYARVHERVVHERPKTKGCSVCKKYFKTDFEVREHQKKAHGSKNRKATVKSKVCNNSVSSLTNHTQLVQGKEEVFRCLQCNSWFLTELALQQHDNNTHKKGKAMDSLGCKKEYRNSKVEVVCGQGLVETVRSHVCSLCNKGFVSKRNLIRHKTNVHSLKESKVKSPPSTVNETGEGIDSDHLRENLRSSAVKSKQSAVSKTGDLCPDAFCEELQSFVCPMCLKRLSSRSNVRRHLATVHSLKETSFKCERSTVSEVRDLDPGPLDGKLQSHVCAICNKGFGSKRSLSRHKASVHPPKEVTVKSELPLPDESKIVEPLCPSGSQGYWLERLFPSVNVTPRETTHSMNDETLSSFPWSVLSCEGNYYCAECSIRFSGRDALKRHNKRFHRNMKLVVRRCTGSKDELDDETSVDDSDSDCWVEEYTLGSFGPGALNGSPFAMRMDNDEVNSSSRNEGILPYTCQQPRLIDNIALKLAKKLT